MKNSFVYEILDLVPTPAFFINAQGRIIYINERFAEEFGDATGTEYLRFLFNKNAMNSDLKKTIISKKGHLFNLDIIPYTAKGKDKINLGLLKDITELKKLRDYVQYLESLNRGISQIYHKQQKLIEKLSKQALTDGLTGLYNHRHFWEQANVELKRANRYSASLSCLMIDIDNFKLVNDRFDHQFGDSVLKGIAKILKTPLRATDILARYGGDEFAVLLPNTDYGGSHVISRKILKRVRQSIFEAKGSSTSITISLGVSSYPADKISDPSQLVEYADSALYNAKAKGKDRISYFYELKSISLN